MRPLFWLAGIVLLLLTTAFGYYLGNHSAVLISHPINNNSTTKMDAGNKVLYYRNPMGLADTSPVPKKDSMGMDYLPVYENDMQQNDIVKIDSHKIQTLGVQTQAVKQQLVSREIRVLGNLAIDESRLINISPRFEGTITRLLVNTTGQQIAKGEILFDVQIPNLYYTEFAYKKAVKKAFDVATEAPDVQRQAELQLTAAMERLDDIGVPLEEMERLQRGGEPFSQIPYRSPAAGVVIEKNVVQGMRFAAGDRLYQIADLSKLWLVMQLPEQELAYIKTGDSLRVELLSEPGKYRKTKIEFIYPALETNTHSIKVRAILDNADYKLKPGQSAEVWLQSQSHKALVIPNSALLDSGREQWVLVAMSPGIYQPKKIHTGERNIEWSEITDGLAEGEEVVTNATFLIDSESRLQAALANFNQSTTIIPASENTSDQTSNSHTVEHQNSVDTQSTTEH